MEMAVFIIDQTCTYIEETMAWHGMAGKDFGNYLIYSAAQCRNHSYSISDRWLASLTLTISN